MIPGSGVGLSEHSLLTKHAARQKGITMTKYEELKAKVEKLITDFNTELDARFKDVEKASAQISEAEARMKAATVAGDPQKYSRAKQDKQRAEDAREMYQTRVRQLQGGEPLVLREEYDKDTREVKAELFQMCLNDKREVVALCKQIEEIVKRNGQALEAANEVLGRYQRDVFHNWDRRQQNSKGEYYVMPMTENKFSDFSLSWLWDHISKYETYKDICKTVEQAADSDQ